MRLAKCRSQCNPVCFACLRQEKSNALEKIGNETLIRGLLLRRTGHAQIQAGKFREDLYKRLNVIPIRIPSLREHKEDIPLLVDHFLDMFDPAGRITEISPEALELLMAYDWPRNVRELRNLIERTLLFMTGPVIEQGHLHLPD